MSDSVKKPSSKREEIRRKVEDSRGQLSRTAEEPRNPVDGLKSVAANYPFAVVLGGVALGAIIGATLPRAFGKRMGKRAAAASALAVELGLAYGKKALEQAGEAAGRLEDLGGSARETVSDSASSATRRAALLIADAGEILAGAGDRTADAARDALSASRDAGHKIAKQAIRLRSHLRH